MKDPLAKIFIPIATLCFLAAFSRSAQRGRRGRVLLNLPLAAVSLCGWAWFVCGNLRLSGSPEYWPREFPYIDRFAVFIHEATNSRWVSPCGNGRTMTIVGAIAAISTGLAGWNAAAALRTSMSADGKSMQLERRQSYYRAMLGAVVGLAIGLYSGLVFIALTNQPAFFLLTLIGTFVGANIGVSFRHPRTHKSI